MERDALRLLVLRHAPVVVEYRPIGRPLYRVDLRRIALWLVENDYPDERPMVRDVEVEWLTPPVVRLWFGYDVVLAGYAWLSCSLNGVEYKGPTQRSLRVVTDDGV